MSASSVPLLVVLDVDSTLSNEEGIDELARAAGLEHAARVADITDKAMCGEIDFATSLAQRLGVLAGVPSSAIDTARSRITATAGAAELIGAVHDAGGVVCAVSGGFHELIDDLMSELGVDAWQANRLGVSDSSLTGGRVGELIDGEAKARWLRLWAHQYDATRVIAVGDGANDLDMMAAADVSVGFVPKPAVRERVDHCVDTRDLSQVIALLEPERV